MPVALDDDAWSEHDSLAAKKCVYHRLSYGDDVRNDVLELKRPPVAAHSTEAHLWEIRTLCKFARRQRARAAVPELRLLCKFPLPLGRGRRLGAGNWVDKLSALLYIIALNDDVERGVIIFVYHLRSSADPRR